MRYCILILSALLLVSSCVKTDDTKSRQELLRDGQWKLDAGSIEYRLPKAGPLAENVNYVIDLYDPIDTVVYWRSENNSQKAYFIHDGLDPECSADDQFVFRENRDGAFLPGELLCSINETAEVEFIWGLTNGNNNMYIYDCKEFFRTDVNADIIEFYNDKFGIRYSEYRDRIVGYTNEPNEFVTDTLIYTMYFVKAGAGGGEEGQ